VQLVIRKYSSGNSFWAEQWTTSVKSVVAYFITSHLWFLQIGSRSNPKGDGVGPFGLGTIYDSPSWCASVLALVRARPLRITHAAFFVRAIELWRMFRDPRFDINNGLG
jgi:hypothetical protein